jgi:hypothetical protein
MWALDLAVVVAADPTEGTHQKFPAIPIALTSDRPGVDPAGAARRVFATIKQRGLPTGTLTGDGLYAHAAHVTFQTPARQTGYDLILPIRSESEGLQETHRSGMLLVDGTYHCPAMPTALQTAVTDYRNGTITLDQFKQLIKERNTYRMRTHQRPDANLQNERLACPASGANPTAVCPFKPASENPRTTSVRNGQRVDERPQIFPTHEPLGVCRSNTVTLRPEDGARFRQAIPFGTDQHHATYTRLRQSQEGLHGFVKDEAYEALGAPTRRRKRGKAAQTLYAAFLFAAAGVRKIRVFLQRAVTLPDGSLGVPRPAVAQNIPLEPPRRVRRLGLVAQPVGVSSFLAA